MSAASWRLDYDRIARAIHYLEAHHAARPALADAAAHVGLSPFHFQRLFRRWAGISPKRFQQHLSAQLAGGLLAGARSVLDATLSAGLSSPGRLHDLLVAVEAMTPGELGRGGAGLAIRYGAGPSPFGPCVLAQTARGICLLAFDDDASPARARAAAEHRWPSAQLREDRRATERTLRDVFRPRAAPRAVLHLAGTNFQLQVWRALLAIAPGQVATYGDVAAALGRPTAQRAVGTAVGANPVAYLIPCHRVIRASGAVGDYRWGTTRKRALLAHEAAQD